MDKQTPVKPQRSKKAPLPPVSKPENKVEETTEDKPYMRRSKIGEPTIGRSPDYVKTVGLGNLTVITANGKRDYN